MRPRCTLAAALRKSQRPKKPCDRGNTQTGLSSCWRNPVFSTQPAHPRAGISRGLTATFPMVRHSICSADLKARSNDSLLDSVTAFSRAACFHLWRLKKWMPTLSAEMSLAGRWICGKSCSVPPGDNTRHRPVTSISVRLRHRRAGAYTECAAIMQRDSLYPD